MINKENILEIIKNPNLGPVQLEFEYKKLYENVDQNEFLNILKEILKDASDREKAICLTFVDMIGKASDFEEIVKENIQNLEMSQNHSLVNSLLWLAAAVSKEWSIEFIQRVIDYNKPPRGEYSYLYNMGIRSLVSTEQWRIAKSEILWIIENYGNEQIVDLLAFFKWKHKEHYIGELLEVIKNNRFLADKVNSLELKINERYIKNYSQLIS
jgi:hypothetical protein